ncbi:MAG: CPBP family intramembrane metalloprotease [Gemmatimonadota bacterium]|jgi:membrane protease YdiL (CAAX protease family)
MSIQSDVARGGALKPLRPVELAWLVGVPTALNAIACRVALPHLDARDLFPIELTYFLCVGLLALAPMFVWALYLSARESPTTRPRDVLARMRVKRIDALDWAWAVATFIALSGASFVIADVVMPRLSLDATPFFFRNMPLASGDRWILAVWPLFFFFNIFGEEFFWRGYVLPRQELLTGRWTWLGHGLFWAVWHIPMGFDLILASFPIFFILPAVVQVRGNTSIAIVVHAVFGAFGFLALALGLLH